MIYFGREYCPAKNHLPSECPICSWVNKAGSMSPEALEAVTSAQELVKYNESKNIKKNKGIVYYSDRMIELEVTPSLSNPVSPQRITSGAVKVEVREEVDAGKPSGAKGKGKKGAAAASSKTDSVESFGESLMAEFAAVSSPPKSSGTKRKATAASTTTTTAAAIEEPPRGRGRPRVSSESANMKIEEGTNNNTVEETTSSKKPTRASRK